MKSNKWIVSHIGAREHYSIAKALDSIGYLQKLYTDFCFTEAELNLLRVFGLDTKKLSNRTVTSISREKIDRQIFLSVIEKVRNPKFRNPFDYWVWKGENFGNNIVKSLNALNNITTWGYTCGNLELLNFSKRNGFRSIHSQIDPYLTYYEIQKRLWEEYPSVEERPAEPTDSFKERLQSELDMAQTIVVNSQYSQQCLVSNGVDIRKIKVIPLCFQSESKSEKKVLERDLEIKVLWVGNINLIKGFYNFFKCAEELSGRGFKFTAVGQVKLKEGFIRNASRYIDFKGQLSKDEIGVIYKQHDLFIFPTYSDGFGMVQLEALSFGLPVISSKNCGQVVIDGYNGYVLQKNDYTEMVEKLNYLSNNKDVFERLSIGALSTSQNYTLDTLSRNIYDKIINVQ